MRGLASLPRRALARARAAAPPPPRGRAARALGGALRAFLRALRPEPLPTPLGPDLRAALLTARRRLSSRPAFLAAGLVVGLVIALPVHVLHGSCPTGEGRGACLLQKAWLPSAILALAPVLAAHVVHVLAFDRAPAWLARWRAGERPRRAGRRQRQPPYRADPFLLAATWGVRTGDQDPGPRPTPASWRAPAEPLPDAPEAEAPEPEAPEPRAPLALAADDEPSAGP